MQTATISIDDHDATSPEERELAERVGRALVRLGLRARTPPVPAGDSAWLRQRCAPCVGGSNPNVVLCFERHSLGEGEATDLGAQSGDVVHGEHRKLTARYSEGERSSAL
jgi:hypothetical protein